MNSRLSPENFLRRFIIQIKSICGDSPEERLCAAVFIQAIQDIIKPAYYYKPIISPPRFKKFIFKHNLKMSFIILYLLIEKNQSHLKRQFFNTEKNSARLWMEKDRPGFRIWCDFSGIDSEWFLGKIEHLKRIKTIHFKKINKEMEGI
jgi:hypothetical protein